VLEAEGIQDTIALDGLTEKLGNIASVGERRAKRTQRRAAKVQKNLQQANEGRKNAEKLIDQAVSNGMEYQSPQVVEAVAAEIETNKQLQAIALREESLQASMLATPIAANPSRTAPHTST
jgi:succinylglutamate desuccinylase